MKTTDYRQWWLSATREQRQEMANAVGSTYKYLQKISGGFGSPSRSLALRLQSKLPRLDLRSFDRAAEQAGTRMLR